ncbi:MAG: TonB-dependent receptor plug domain-containing protein, partial [Desulfuromonadaceae bacterium]
SKGYTGLNGAVGKVGFSLAASHLETDGYSLANADNNRIPHAGNTSEDDGWSQTSASGKFNIDITDNTALNVVARYTEAKMDIDDDIGYAIDNFIDPNGMKKQREESERLFGKVELVNEILDGRFESVLGYKFARQDRDSYAANGDFGYGFVGDSDEWSWQGNLSLMQHSNLSFGANLFSEEFDSTFSKRTEEARTLSYWGQYQLILRGFDVVAGVRYDDHEEFGGKTTWRIAPAYTFASTGTILRWVYATGFRTPSLYELYSDYGSESLDPEESTSFEIGVEQPVFNDRLVVGITYFWMEFEDRIDWAWPDGYAQVKGESNTSGVEAFIAWYVTQELDVRLDYTYTDTENENGFRMELRPLNQIHTGINYTPVEKVGVSLDAYWVDERKAYSNAIDKDGTPVEVLDDYFLVNIAANYDLTDALRIYARVDNLLDEHYEEAWSYATPGQSFYAGAKFSF